MFSFVYVIPFLIYNLFIFRKIEKMKKISIIKFYLDINHAYDDGNDPPETILVTSFSISSCIVCIWSTTPLADAIFKASKDSAIDLSINYYKINLKKILFIKNDHTSKHEYLYLYTEAFQLDPFLELLFLKVQLDLL